MSNTPLSTSNPFNTLNPNTSNPYSSLSTSYPTTSTTLQSGGSGGSTISTPFSTSTPSTSTQFSSLSTSYPTTSTTLQPGGSSTSSPFISRDGPLCGLNCARGFETSRDPSGQCVCVPVSIYGPLCGLNCARGFEMSRDTSGQCVCVPVSSNTSSPFTSTPSTTSNPSNLTTTKPSGPNRDIGAIDLNGYIRLAINSIVNEQHASAMNFTNLAINIQTQAGNGVGVAMLQSANQYIQAIINPLLNNFDVPSANLSSIAIYFLVGTILCLCYMKNGLSLKGVYDPNIQNALNALNTNPPNITNATKSLNTAINAAIVANDTQLVNMLQQILGVVENYSSSTLKNLPLTPLQLCLTDFPLVLIYLDGYPMKFSSINNYSVLWGSGKGQEQIQTQHANTNQDMFLGKNAHQRHGQNTGTNLSQFQTQGNVESNVPDAIQQYLVSRSILNGAMNDLVNYLTTKNNYQPLISNIQQIQNNMNTI